MGRDQSVRGSGGLGGRRVRGEERDMRDFKKENRGPGNPS